VRVWDGLDGREILSLPIQSADVPAIAIASDGNFLAVSDDRVVRIWDTRTGETRQVLQGHTDRITAMAFSFDGMGLAMCSIFIMHFVLIDSPLLSAIGRAGWHTARLYSALALGFELLSIFLDRAPIELLLFRCDRSLALAEICD
jgi:hypothetical protein